MVFLCFFCQIMASDHLVPGNRKYARYNVEVINQLIQTSNDVEFVFDQPEDVYFDTSVVPIKIDRGIKFSARDRNCTVFFITSSDSARGTNAFLVMTEAWRGELTEVSFDEVEMFSESKTVVFLQNHGIYNAGYRKIFMNVFNSYIHGFKKFFSLKGQLDQDLAFSSSMCIVFTYESFDWFPRSYECFLLIDQCLFLLK